MDGREREGGRMIVICLVEYDNPYDNAIISPTFFFSFHLINPVKMIQPARVLPLFLTGLL